MRKYKKEDFENMIFNPYPYSKGRDLLDLYPDLRNHDEFEDDVEGVDKTQLLTYIFLMYDKESPLVINITDLSKRKDEALELAGFSKKAGKWDKEVIEFRTLGNKEVNKVIAKFFFLQHANKFEFMVSLEEAYSQMCQELRNPVGGDAEERLKSLKIKGAVAKEAAGISNDIDELRRGIFKEDTKAADMVEDEDHEQRVVAGIKEQRAARNKLKIV